MKKYISLSIMMLCASIVITTSAFTKHFHECEAHWFIKPKIGVAPTLFMHKAHQMFVIPRAAYNGEFDPATPERALQDMPYPPSFSDMFHQGVLHAGVEVGREVCDRGECFLEFTYNRAQGRLYEYGGHYIGGSTGFSVNKNILTTIALQGCTPDCTSAVDCLPEATNLISDLLAIHDEYGIYQAYGLYLGARHFTKPLCCPEFSLWCGYKIGFVHRNRIDALTRAVIDTINSLCPNYQGVTTFKRSIFCKGNVISGGLQLGADYCYNNNLTMQLGFEVVASAGLTGNRNYFFDISNIPCPAQNLQQNIRAPINYIFTNTGTLLSFPVWIALTWEFDPCLQWCKRLCGQ